MFLSLVRKHAGGDPERMRRVLAGLRRYQEFERPPPAPLMPAIAERKGAVLRDYGGGEGPPILFVPSLINPPNVLDLGPDRSLLRWLAARGHRTLLLDWGWPDRERASLDISGHVEKILVPMVRGLGSEVRLAGYCLGGTMAAAAASLTRVSALAMIASPWHFSGFPDGSREDLSLLWERGRGTADQLGLLPMEVLQSAFWSLDPERTVGKFEAFAAMDAARAARFVALEDWANDGPPLAAAAARELFETMFAEDAPGRGQWVVGGRAVDPARLGAPVLDIVSTTDRIVPAATASRAGDQLELGSGHVGMVVGSRAGAGTWIPLEAWLSRTAA